MKKLAAIIMCILLAALLAASCSAKPEESAAPVDIAATPEPETQTGEAQYGHSAGVSITATAAYVFEGTEGLTLYGAVEYQNTGNCPIYISKASFAFDAGGSSITHDYSPALGEYTVVLPGDTSFEAVWITAPEGLAAGDEVTLRASLTAVEAAAPRVSLKVSGLYTADNYPGFSTLSGSVECTSQTGCSANMIYVGFYGEDGTFLGAWYFSKNAVLEQGDAKNFVVNMQEFPLPDMGEKTASYKAAAFGFEF